MDKLLFSNPLGFLGLLGIPAVLVIHLFRQRFRKRQVAGLFLWAQLRRAAPAGRSIERIYNSRSLWLELLAVLVLSVIMAGPNWNDMAAGRHLVIILDNSASMSAKGSSGRSFAELAGEQIRERLKSVDRATLVVTGARPTLIAGPAVPVPTALAELGKWQPHLPAHDYDAAFVLAQQIAAASADILFVTDSIPPDTGFFSVAEVLSVGSPLENVAILGARRTMDLKEGGSTVFFRLANYSSRDRVVPVTLKLDSRILFQDEIAVTARSQGKATLKAPPGRDILKLEIGPDALAIDNFAYLPMPGTSPVAVA
ncbi:BatA and WFA domain-containing protein, partial [Planctomycetota bacterium]